MAQCVQLLNVSFDFEAHNPGEHIMPKSDAQQYARLAKALAEASHLITTRGIPLSRLFIYQCEGELFVDDQGYGVCLECLEYSLGLGHDINYLMECDSLR